MPGVSVIGIWRRGRFEVATAETTIDANSVLLLAGSEEQLRRYDELFCIYHVSSAPVIIIGGGRVGRATARALERARGRLPHRRDRAPSASAIRRNTSRATPPISPRSSAPACARRPPSSSPPHDDDQNIYLTIYCRRLRPDVQIITRAVRERNVSTLHRAGADFVLSYAWMGATAIFNYLKRADVLMVAEGLHVCETEVPPALAGKTLAEAAIPRETGCSVVALRTAAGLQINPPADEAAAAPASASCSSARRRRSSAF